MRVVFAVLLVCTLFSSCRVFYPDLMFQTNRKYTYDKPDSAIVKEYRLQQGDVFSMQVLSNNGYALVDVVGFNGSYLPIDYNVHVSGYASIPLLDSVYVVGLTSAQLEDTLSIKYSYFFINPFIRINIKNRQVFVISPRTTARIVELKNDNVTLVEAIASSGGIIGGRAKSIRVVRGVGQDAKVYKFDLSTVEGYKQMNFYLRNNDIVYIEPIRGPKEFYSTIGPFLSIMSSLLFVYTVFVLRK